MGNVQLVCQRAIVGLVGVYQRVLSPLKPGCCRFVPSCSEYAKLAVVKYGCLRGMWLAARRVVRCHPFSRGGYDPVP